MASAFVSAIVSLTVAGMGFWFTVRNTKRVNERQDRLLRINRQLSALYGPMLTLASATESAWHSFLLKHDLESVSLSTAPGDVDVDRNDWVIWVRAVFMPLNRRLFDVILGGGDLLIEDEMPPVLLAFSAHVSSWEATIARWDDQDFDELTAAIGHPGRSLLRYAEHGYAVLKKQQNQLIAHLIQGGETA